MNEQYKPVIGDFITIVKWLNIQDNSWIGACLKILHIEDNILSLEEHTSLGVFMSPFTINLSQVEIKPLSPEFVKLHSGQELTTWWIWPDDTVLCSEEGAPEEIYHDKSDDYYTINTNTTVGELINHYGSLEAASDIFSLIHEET